MPFFLNPLPQVANFKQEQLYFISKNVTLKTNTNNSLFTKKIEKNELLTMPIAHKQGNYTADNDIIKKLEDEDRIVFTYVPINGNNPNGSMSNIGGIINENRNVLGMMPHPERACDKILGSEDGRIIFESMIGEN